MNIFQILLLAFSLSADAFAVSITTGLQEKKVKFHQSFSMSACFGFFQAIMPVIGFYFATLFLGVISGYDHWIAFILLAYIGGNMIYEGSKESSESDKVTNIFGLRSLLFLGIATSIDALAVGISLTATESSILLPAIIIGIITFIASFIGIEFGKKFGKHIGGHAEIIGGGILVIIGLKILIEHLYF